MNYGSVELTPERRRGLLREASLQARPGDLLFSIIARAFARVGFAASVLAICPTFACTSATAGSSGCSGAAFAGTFWVASSAMSTSSVSFAGPPPCWIVARYRGRREAMIDLVVLAVLVLVERVFGARMGRRLLPYQMRGVTCSGVVSSAWHSAHGLESWCDPMKHTPLDLERAVGKASFFEASLIPPAPTPRLAPAIATAREGGER